MTLTENLLQKTSRTFALTIPFLPEPTRREVEVAYLLFRIVDTFEDASLWAPARRIDVMTRFVDALEQAPSACEGLVDACAREPPVKHPGYLELLAKMRPVLERYAGLRSPARGSIRRHVTRSANAMIEFVRRSDGEGRLALTTLDELRRYCYAVAGIVGEMLTELYLLGRPELEWAADGLRSRSARFGEGLQLVNILKDARGDADEGRTYLPPQVPLADVLATVADDLAAATEYVELLREAGTEPGLVAFNAAISRLARANLDLFETRGLGAKLSRLDVARIQAEVVRELERREATLRALSHHG